MQLSDGYIRILILTNKEGNLLRVGGKSAQSRIVLQGLESKQKRIVRGNPSQAGYVSEERNVHR